MGCGDVRVWAADVRGVVRGRERRDARVGAPHAHLRRRVVLGGVHRLSQQRCNEGALADCRASKHHNTRHSRHGNGVGKKEDERKKNRKKRKLSDTQKKEQNALKRGVCGIREGECHEHVRKRAVLGVIITDEM